ncbi:hypothetical protein FISHEDRAFT_67762 [Fistulina hepatica ATCC 64428]|nr:hypothetical protein FISHEDRAFT_67762 [Fistulina hepatica ATCC 64428]
MSTNPLIGNVFERKTTAQRFQQPPPASAARTGFPSAQHRTKSAFARARNARNKASLNSRAVEPPEISNVAKDQRQDNLDISASSEGRSIWQRQIGRENESRVASMSEEEREQERQELVERFGADLLQKVMLARQKRDAKPESKPWEEALRSPGKLGRKLRFAKVDPTDVHVYESAPPSPRKKTLLALPPPTGDPSEISIGRYKGRPTFTSQKTSVDEGTPEDIRTRFFPDVPADDPAIEWMQPLTSATPDSSLRFDLNGVPIPPEVSAKLPTHLGLHHHAEGSHAGYTLDDIFLLTRSTVPAQRATMLGVLCRILRQMSKTKEDGIEGLLPLAEDIRKRMLAAGVEAMSERGSVGTRAVELMWECVVGCNDSDSSADEICLEYARGDSILQSLQLDFLLPQINQLFDQRGLQHESYQQLLLILHRLAKQNAATATTIVTTNGLLSNVAQTLLLSSDSTFLPTPEVIDLLCTLVRSSRSNAQALASPADALLRFVAILPPSSHYPTSLATTLLTKTLQLYTLLASYGMSANIATAAAEQWMSVERFVASSRSRPLLCAWAHLLETWMTCAIDPHRTSPPHEILWSQIVGWDWAQDIHNLKSPLDIDVHDRDAWTALWIAQAVWLEGAQINGIRAGEQERKQVVELLLPGFGENGREGAVLHACMDAIYGELKAGSLSSSSALHAISAAIRLFVACLPPALDEVPESPPFPFPFSRVSVLCEKVVGYAFDTFTFPQVTVIRLDVSELLSQFLRLSKRSPTISKDLWLAQAFAILPLLLPGSEACVLQTLRDMYSIVSPDWAATHTPIPSVFWEKGGFTVIQPFLVHAIRPREEVYVSSRSPTPESVQLATALRLPANLPAPELGLPLYHDWMFSALGQLLRSGTSPVFKHLPASWNASETDIARTSLVLAKVSNEVLSRFSMDVFALSPCESIFACMQIIMLEHNQNQEDQALGQEVFRDPIVSKLMEDLLRARSVRSAARRGNDLEVVSARFLGRDTPFFQFYTDFVGLYDAISYGHPVFACLLFPPTAMHYPLDYRKHLYTNYRHILVKTDVREYLYPVERDAHILGAFLAVLLEYRGVAGVETEQSHAVRFIVLHHVAAAIWPDLASQDSDPTKAEERASKLWSAIAEQGSSELVKDVFHYSQQVDNGPVRLPPTCYDRAVLDETAVSSRKTCIRRWTPVRTDILDDLCK